MKNGAEQKAKWKYWTKHRTTKQDKHGMPKKFIYVLQNKKEIDNGTKI